MSDQEKQPRKMRSITSTFDLRDVAVVAVAAFTAAGPFFAYDKRISLTEEKIEKIRESDAELKQMVKDLDAELRLHLREYRAEQAALAEHERKERGQPPSPNK